MPRSSGRRGTSRTSWGGDTGGCLEWWRNDLDGKRFDESDECHDIGKLVQLFFLENDQQFCVALLRPCGFCVVLPRRSNSEETVVSKVVWTMTSSMFVFFSTRHIYDFLWRLAVRYCRFQGGNVTLLIAKAVCNAPNTSAFRLLVLGEFHRIKQRDT